MTDHIASFSPDEIKEIESRVSTQLSIAKVRAQTAAGQSYQGYANRYESGSAESLHREGKIVGQASREGRNAAYSRAVDEHNLNAMTLRNELVASPAIDRETLKKLVVNETTADLLLRGGHLSEAVAKNTNSVPDALVKSRDFHQRQMIEKAKEAQALQERNAQWQKNFEAEEVIRQQREAAKAAEQAQQEQTRQESIQREKAAEKMRLESAARDPVGSGMKDFRDKLAKREHIDLYGRANYDGIKQGAAAEIGRIKAEGQRIGGLSTADELSITRNETIMKLATFMDGGHEIHDKSFIKNGRKATLDEIENNSAFTQLRQHAEKLTAPYSGQAPADIWGAANHTEMPAHDIWGGSGSAASAAESANNSTGFSATERQGAINRINPSTGREEVWIKVDPSRLEAHHDFLEKIGVSADTGRLPGDPARYIAVNRSDYDAHFAVGTSQPSAARLETVQMKPHAYVQQQQAQPDLTTKSGGTQASQAREHNVSTPRSSETPHLDAHTHKVVQPSQKMPDMSAAQEQQRQQMAAHRQQHSRIQQSASSNVSAATAPYVAESTAKPDVAIQTQQQQLNASGETARPVESLNGEILPRKSGAPHVQPEPVTPKIIEHNPREVFRPSAAAPTAAAATDVGGGVNVAKGVSIEPSTAMHDVAAAGRLGRLAPFVGTAISLAVGQANLPSDASIVDRAKTAADAFVPGAKDDFRNVREGSPLERTFGAIETGSGALGTVSMGAAVVPGGQGVAAVTGTVSAVGMAVASIGRDAAYFSGAKDVGPGAVGALYQRDKIYGVVASVSNSLPPKSSDPAIQQLIDKKAAMENTEIQAFTGQGKNRYAVEINREGSHPKLDAYNQSSVAYQSAVLDMAKNDPQKLKQTIETGYRGPEKHKEFAVSSVGRYHESLNSSTETAASVNAKLKCPLFPQRENVLFLGRGGAAVGKGGRRAPPGSALAAPALIHSPGAAAVGTGRKPKPQRAAAWRYMHRRGRSAFSRPRSGVARGRF